MKTSIKIGIVITYILAVLASSCTRFLEPKVKSSGTSKIITKEVPAFNKIKVTGQIDLIVKSGDKSEVIIKADTMFSPFIVAGVDKDGKLNIYTNKKLAIYKNDKIVITVTTPSLKLIKALGACDITIDSLITNDLEVNLSGACVFKGRIECDTLSINSQGSSEMELKGKSKKYNLNVSGANEIKSCDFSSSDIEVKALGANEIEIKVEDKLDVNLSGASELKYKGDLRNIKQKITGASKIKKID